jgi:hypothetical protein
MPGPSTYSQEIGQADESVFKQYEATQYISLLREQRYPGECENCHPLYTAETQVSKLSSAWRNRHFSAFSIWLL